MSQMSDNSRQVWKNSWRESNIDSTFSASAVRCDNSLEVLNKVEIVHANCILILIISR